MDNKAIPFAELMNAVLDQLRFQRYMESTLTDYRRIYNRIHVFLSEHGTDIYTHELGKAFIDGSKVGKSALSSYVCAVRRLDDYIDGKPYRYHHENQKVTSPDEFWDVVSA